MQQGDSQQQQQSPRGGVPRLSFLGHYASSPCHGFSILGALEQQQQPQPHFHHQVQMATATAPPLQNLLHQGFLLTTGPTQPGYNLQLAAAPQMLLEDLIKLSPPGSPPVPLNAGTSAPASYNVNLVSLLEQKTEQLRTLVHSFSHNAGSGVLQPHAAMAAARIASSISQIALAAVGVVPNAAHSLLPDMQQHGLFSSNNSTSSTLQVATAAVRNPLPVVEQQQHKQHQDSGAAAFNLEVAQLVPGKNVSEGREPLPMVPAVVPTDDGDSGAGSRDEDDDGEAEDLVPGSYDLVEMNAVEILAEHTHFCDKCGKGFKRDANLRMHMRGHGEQYKSPAALARPDKFSQDNAAVVRPRRYSCPYAGCKRNKKHRKFQPLKTVLCVKNHYRRSHCPKSLTCSKCKSKKFSVVADLKTHEKHCGRDKWQCSCGTTFSRKDKLLGHIGLFQGHTPALPLQDTEASTSAAAASEQAMNEDIGRSDLVGMASGS